jgi:hypothetical protein
VTAGVRVQRDGQSVRVLPTAPGSGRDTSTPAGGAGETPAAPKAPPAKS